MYQPSKLLSIVDWNFLSIDKKNSAFFIKAKIINILNK